MLRWALAFLIVALVAAIFGFTEVAAGAAWIAKALCFAFLVAFLWCVAFGFRRRRVIVVRTRDPKLSGHR